jgi:hypothetical protein
LVPDHYIENELKEFLNKNFKVDPAIPLKGENNWDDIESM